MGVNARRPLFCPTFNCIIMVPQMMPTDLVPGSLSSLNNLAGRAVPAGSSDVAADFDALLSGCGVYEMPWRTKIFLTGSDRVRWLNGIVTNNVRDLPIGRGVYAFVLNPQGRILGDLFAFNREKSLLVDTDISQLEKVLAIFDRYIIMDDVEVNRENLSAVGIKGPKAGGILAKAGFEIPDLEPLEFVDLVWKGISVTVVRGDSPKIDEYAIWAAPEDITVLVDSLIAAGAKKVGADSLDLMRIAEGVPQYGRDIRERDLPQETNQQRALHFTKGCYIGQEIVERIRSRGNVHRTFTGFDVTGTVPPPGTKLHVEGKEVGEITSSAILPLHGLERPAALGYIRREVAGKPIALDGATLSVASLPFTEVFNH